MTLRSPLHALTRALPLLFVLAFMASGAALSQPVAPDPVELEPAARARLAQAAEDERLAPWQRDYMLGLARTGAPAPPDPAAADLRAAQPALATGADDGAWAATAVQPDARRDHSAIYDPVRDCMVVFGGYTGSGYLGDVWVLSLAGAPAWTRLIPSGISPSARAQHSAIYDPARDRMVVFGGSTGSGLLNDVWALSLSGSPSWTQLAPTGTIPAGRASHSAIYDPVRDRMVVFGGYTLVYLNEVWELSLAGTPAWTQLTPTGTPPVTRYAHSAIYDPVRDRMLVFGGYCTGQQQSNDVWALSLADVPAWTQMTPTGTLPDGRSDHSAVYDPVRDCMVVFGGVNDFHNDAWTLSLAGTPAWTQLTPTGTLPSVRCAHTAIYDPLRDRVVVFGGLGSSYSSLDDAWELSLADTPRWTPLAPPIARDCHVAIYDPVRDRMVVFGGLGAGSPLYMNDVWTLSLAGTPAWTQLTPAGTPPAARSYHSAVYDPARNRMVVFGGYNGTYLNDVWTLSLTDAPAWTLLTPAGTPPSARCNHSAICDPVRDQMMVFGGGDGSGSRNDVWALSLADTPAWTQLTPTGTLPGARSVHSAIYDPPRDRMVIFGGYRGSYFNDVWALSLAAPPAWTQLTPAGTPPSGRRYHSAIYEPVLDRMVVFGGYRSAFLNDTWSLSLAGTPAWAQLTPAGTPPSPRDCHSAIHDPVRARMVVFGGYGGSYLNDVWMLEWSFATAVDEPPPAPLVGYLRPPAPNPARGTTAVSFALAQAGRVQLGVYDVSGRLVRRLVDGECRAGAGTVVWNGTNEPGARLQAGVYFVRLAGPGLRATRSVILLE